MLIDLAEQYSIFSEFLIAQDEHIIWTDVQTHKLSNLYFMTFDQSTIDLVCPFSVLVSSFYIPALQSSCAQDRNIEMNFD